MLGCVLAAVLAGLTPAIASASRTTSTSATGHRDTHPEQAHARAELLKKVNFPSGWTGSGSVWIGTSDSQNSDSLLTISQYPQLTDCLGIAAPLSVVATEASSPYFVSKDLSTDVVDTADVYQSVAQAEIDFPPFNNPKFADCFAQVAGGGPISDDVKSDYDSGTIIGTPTAKLVAIPKYGSQSGMIEVQFPLTFTDGSHGDEFFNVLLIRQGRSTTELDLDSSGTPAGATLTASLAAAVVAKMKAIPAA